MRENGNRESLFTSPSKGDNLDGESKLDKSEWELKSEFWSIKLLTRFVCSLLSLWELVFSTILENWNERKDTVKKKWYSKLHNHMTVILSSFSVAKLYWRVLCASLVTLIRCQKPNTILILHKRAMMALGRSPEYHWNQIISKSVHRFSRRSCLKLFFYF